VNKLSDNERVRRARKEYFEGMVRIWEMLKKKFNVDDELLACLIESPCELDPRPMWEEELDKLREELEEKYDVCIEHEDDEVRCFAW